MRMSVALALWSFVFGSVIGSFLNVVIHRVPRGESVVHPPSRCPGCGSRIRWFDNVPIFAWLWLLGRCRDCRTGISIRYPLIELATALFFLAIYLHAGLSWAALLLAAIVPMTIALIYIDLDIQILPDVIDKPGIILGVILGAIEAGEYIPTMIVTRSLIESVVGAALGWGVLFAISRLYQALRDIEGMGRGDLKMMAMIGAVCGWPALLPVLFIASITGAVFGIVLAMRRGTGLQIALPFGVFLGLAFLVTLFFGPTLISWFLPPVA